MNNTKKTAGAVATALSLLTGGYTYQAVQPVSGGDTTIHEVFDTSMIEQKAIVNPLVYESNIITDNFGYNVAPPPLDQTGTEKRTLWVTPQSKINVLVLGDGYTLSEKEKFWQDAQTTVNGMSSEPVCLPYKNYFRYDVKYAPSFQSGISNTQCYGGTVGEINTRYSVTCNYGQTCRLFYARNQAQAQADATSDGINYQMVLIISNTTHYGGSGGLYPVASMNYQSIEIMLHEAWGHRFAGSKDEYTGGNCSGVDGHNVAQDSIIARNKWGKYKTYRTPRKGSNYSSACWWDFGAYKRNGVSHLWCKMDKLGYPFCPPDSAAIVSKIKTLANITEPTEPPTQCTVTASFTVAYTSGGKPYIRYLITKTNGCSLYTIYKDGVKMTTLNFNNYAPTVTRLSGSNTTALVKGKTYVFKVECDKGCSSSYNVTVPN